MLVKAASVKVIFRPLHPYKKCVIQDDRGCWHDTVKAKKMFEVSRSQIWLLLKQITRKNASYFEIPFVI
jgi:hypothetical protein